jgi:pyrimidine-specific ribonucleoside hydrolase
VIVDYSPTVSDVGALIYLLSHPEVDVQAVTLPVTGEAGCELGVEVTLGILAMFDRADIPVACDPEPPSAAEDWPEAFLAGADALALTLPKPISSPDPRPAHQLIADTVAASDSPVVLYAVAPLTNIARAVETHPALADGVDRIVIMGGAVAVPGNVVETNAEWNLWIDVPAADRVLKSAIPVVLVPLDATNHVQTPGLWDIDLVESSSSEPARYLSSMIEVFPQTTAGGFYLWDELAAAVAAGEDLVTIEDLNLIVGLEPGSAYGSTMVDPEGAEVSVATSVPDPAAFYANFLSTLAGTEIEPRSVSNWSAGSPPPVPGPGSTPEESLGYWVANALEGDSVAAASVVAPGARWVGLGASPDVFVTGSAPYQAYDTDLACSAAAETALCTATWNDLWIEANPDLALGSMRVRAIVSGGMIVDFAEFSFSQEIAEAFDGHFEWLAASYPDHLAAACSGDGASPQCSELLVETVDEWVAAASS